MNTFVLSTPTKTILGEIENKKLTQKDVAKTCALAIALHHEETDWKAINEAIVKRWSLSARERVLTMAWKIVEDWKSDLRGEA